MTIDDRLNSVISELISEGTLVQVAVSMFRQRYISAGLSRTGGNVKMAAQKLGVHRNTVHLDIRRFELRKR